MTGLANNKTVEKPSGESAVDGATRLNHNRRQREEKWDQDELESGNLVFLLTK